MRDSRLLYLLVGALTGVLLSILATIVYWERQEAQLRLQAVTLEIVDQTHSLVPLLISLEEQDLEALQRAARTQLATGIIIAHTNLDALNENGRRIVLPVLESLAAKRSRMKIGSYATPPQLEVESILSLYDQQP